MEEEEHKFGESKDSYLTTKLLRESKGKLINKEAYQAYFNTANNEESAESGPATNTNGRLPKFVSDHQETSPENCGDRLNVTAKEQDTLNKRQL